MNPDHNTPHHHPPRTTPQHFQPNPNAPTFTPSGQGFFMVGPQVALTSAPSEPTMQSPHTPFNPFPQPQHYPYAHPCYQHFPIHTPSDTQHMHMSNDGDRLPAAPDGMYGAVLGGGGQPAANQEYGGGMRGGGQPAANRRQGMHELAGNVPDQFRDAIDRRLGAPMYGGHQQPAAGPWEGNGSETEGGGNHIRRSAPSSGCSPSRCSTQTTPPRDWRQRLRISGLFRYIKLPRRC